MFKQAASHVDPADWRVCGADARGYTRPVQPRRGRWKVFRNLCRGCVTPTLFSKSHTLSVHADQATQRVQLAREEAKDFGPAGLCVWQSAAVRRQQETSQPHSKPSTAGRRQQGRPALPISLAQMNFQKELSDPPCWFHFHWAPLKTSTPVCWTVNMSQTQSRRRVYDNVWGCHPRDDQGAAPTQLYLFLYH